MVVRWEQARTVSVRDGWLIGDWLRMLVEFHLSVDGLNDRLND